MSRTIALGALLLTLATSTCAYAQVQNDPANNGKNANFVKNGAMVKIYHANDGIQKDDDTFILIETGKLKAGDIPPRRAYCLKEGDGIYRIMNKSNMYLSLTRNFGISMESATLSVAPDGKKTVDNSKITKWILHLSPEGWRIMPVQNMEGGIGDLPITRNKKQDKSLPLIVRMEVSPQGNSPSHFWMIKQIGFAVNPELPSAGTTTNNVPGASGQVTLKAGFTPDPHTADVQAGGDEKKSEAGVNAWTSKAATYRLNYTAGSYPLTFKVECAKDTTLTIRTPDGKFLANDDQAGNNLNPLVRIASPQSGAYDIWVGVFSPTDKGANAKLQITELK